MIASPDAFGGADLWQPRADGMEPDEARRCAMHDNVRYVVAIFVAGAATVLLLAGVSSFGFGAG